MGKSVFQKRQIIFYLLSLAAVFFCAVSIFSGGVLREPAGNARPQMEWVFQDENGLVRPTTLPQQLKLSQGESATLYCRLPDVLAGQRYLFFFASQQQVQVQVDGQPVYTSGPELARGEQWIMIPLTAADSGGQVQITLTSQGVRLPNLFYPVYLGSMDACLSSIWADLCAPAFLCLAIFITGLVALIFSFYNIKSVEEAEAMRYVGWWLLLAAIWGMTQTRLLSLVLVDGTFIVLIDQVLRVLIPLPLVLSFRAMIREGNFQKELDNFFILFAAYCVLCLVLHATGIYALTVTAWWSQLLLLVFFVYSGVFGVVEFRAAAKYTAQQRLYSSMILTVLLTAALYLLLLLGFDGARFLPSPSLSGSIYFIIACLLCAAILLITLREMRVLLYIQDELAHSQMKLMLSQIKPHFLYNTLNSIRTLIRTDPGSADQMVYYFSRFLRSNIRSISSSALIPFSEELDHIMAYANIEQTCFKKLKMSYDIQARNFRVPPLTIQPLVENAIKHGVLQRVEGGQVQLHTYETAEHYCLEIQDDGVGFDPTNVYQENHSHGLKNVQMRLEYYCQADFTIDSEPGQGSTVYVKIPKSARRRRSNANDTGRR